MDVTQQPAPLHVAHDVLDGTEGEQRVRLVAHGQENAARNLDHQHQQCQRAEEIPEVEIFRRVVFGKMLPYRAHQRKAFINPAD